MSFKRLFLMLLNSILCFFIFTNCLGRAIPNSLPSPTTNIDGILEIYSGPGNELYRSPLYKVEIWNGNEWIESYTYHISRHSVTNWHRGRRPSVNFTTFGITENVNVRISLLSGRIRSIQISPKSKQIENQIINNMAVFTISQKDKLWITVNNDDANPLFIFADPPKPPVPAGAVYFGSGIHDIGKLYKPRNGQVIYLDGGAWVKGSIDLRGVNNVRIMGPGVLSGEALLSEEEWNTIDINGHIEEVRRNNDHEHTMQYNMILGTYGAHNTGNILEGITITNAPSYFTRGGVNTARNVKLISPWNLSTDGFLVMPDSNTLEGLIEDCFAFVGDDVFFPTLNEFGNITVRNCFVGSTNNNIFSMGYFSGPINNQYSFLAENIDIKTYNDHAIFQAVLSGSENDVGKGIHNMVFKDIRIEGNINCPLIWIENRPYPWNEYGFDMNSPSLGRSMNIQFINITLEGSQGNRSVTIGNTRTPRISRIYGKDSFNSHNNILFENISIGGTRLTARNLSRYFDINAFVYDVKIKNDSNVEIVRTANPAHSQTGEILRSAFSIFDNNLNFQTVWHINNWNCDVNLRHQNEGRLAISYGNAGQSGYLRFNLVRQIDWQYLVSQGYALIFNVKADKPASFDVMFINIEDGNNIPWKVTRKIDVPADGNWHVIRIPLSSMREWGAWVESTQSFRNPQGRFLWNNVVTLSFEAEYGGFDGLILFDEIKIEK